MTIRDWNDLMNGSPVQTWKGCSDFTVVRALASHQSDPVRFLPVLYLGWVCCLASLIGAVAGIYSVGGGGEEKGGEHNTKEWCDSYIRKPPVISRGVLPLHPPVWSLALRVFLWAHWFSFLLKDQHFQIQFDRDSGPTWKPARIGVASSINIIICYIFIIICGKLCSCKHMRRDVIVNYV